MTWGYLSSYPLFDPKGFGKNHNRKNTNSESVRSQSDSSSISKEHKLILDRLELQGSDSASSIKRPEIKLEPSPSNKPPSQGQDLTHQNRLEKSPNRNAKDASINVTVRSTPQIKTEGESTEVKRLRALNPLNWLRVYSWLFFRTEILMQYEKHTEDSIRPIGSWLTSTLILLPSFTLISLAQFNVLQ